MHTYLRTTVLLCGVCSAAQGQNPVSGPANVLQKPVLTGDTWYQGTRQSEPTASDRIARVHLFVMPSACPSIPVGLDLDDNPPSDVTGPATVSSGSPDPNDKWLQLALGSDNPFFDIRRNGDPGGVGYYKLHSQVLLVDGQKAGASLGLQAVTPAGLDAEGIEDGPTIVSPNFAWFYEVSDGTAIQGFVGNNIRTRSHLSQRVPRNLQYGLALQSPFPGVDASSVCNMHLFVEALGRYHMAGSAGERMPTNLEVLPGLHVQMSESWWIAGGFLMPVGTARSDNRLWQITCSWQF